MYKIYFYKDKKGRQPVLEYIQKLGKRTDKDSRIKSNKIHDYIKILEEFGVSAGEPYIKHLSGNLWELRPLRDRIIFVCWIENSYILLHSFTKKTQKTPKKEIERAIKEVKEIEENGGL